MCSDVEVRVLVLCDHPPAEAGVIRNGSLVRLLSSCEGGREMRKGRLSATYPGVSGPSTRVGCLGFVAGKEEGKKLSRLIL